MRCNLKCPMGKGDMNHGTSIQRNTMQLIKVDIAFNDME